MSADNKKQEGSTEPTPKCSDDTPNLPTVQVMYRAQLINEPTQTEGEKKSDGPPKLPTLPSLVTKPQMQHFQDLGLGKGVNIADPKPWANRSSFQVRNVTEDIIDGSDEGGAYEGYETEVESAFNAYFQMESSLAIPNSPVSIGVDTEQSRTVSTSRRTVGKRVLTRTIAYKAEKAVSFMNPFERHMITWILTWTLQRVKDAKCKQLKEEIGKIKTTDAKTVQDEKMTEDETTDGKTVQDKKMTEDESPITTQIVAAIDKALTDGVQESLQAFMNTFRITHYVSAIHLGASSYYVYTEEEYNTEVKSKASVTVPNLGGGSATVKYSKHERKKMSKEKKIGHIRVDGNGDATVKMGTPEEAVVGIKMLPISTLITHPELRRKVVATTKLFFETSQDYSFGPFYIATKDESLLLSVDQEQKNGQKMTYVVHAVKNPKTALQGAEETSQTAKPALFHVLPTDNPAQPHEFFLTYIPDHPLGAKDTAIEAESVDGPTPKHEGEDIDEEKIPVDMKLPPRYLTAPTNMRGFCQGPLELKMNVRKSNAAFTLVNRVLRVSRPVSTAPWVSSRDAYFIKCSSKLLSRHSYLAVVKQCEFKPVPASDLEQQTRWEKVKHKLWKGPPGKPPDPSWVLRCMPSTNQEDRDDVSMLFRLLPSGYLYTPTEQSSSAIADASDPTAPAQRRPSTSAYMTTAEIEPAGSRN